MTDEKSYSAEQKELIRQMKKIGADLWGAVQGDPGEKTESDETGKKEPAREKKNSGIGNLWKVADETIDWTDALAHSHPTDGLTAPRLWRFYHEKAEKVLHGDLNAYTEVLKAANPLGELTDYAEGINMRAPAANRLESTFQCKPEMMEENPKLYLSAMGLRIARDLLACLPVSEVSVTGERNGKVLFTATYQRPRLMHRNFAFLDPVSFAEECGAEFSETKK